MSAAPVHQPSATLRDELLEATARCARRAQDVYAVVLEEAQCLQEQQLDALTEVTARKTEQLGRLERADQRWRQLFAQTGLPEGRIGVRQLLRGADDELRATWETLERTLDALQAQNEANGRLIHRSLDHNRRLLDVFFMDQREQSPVTYGTDGAQQAGGGRRREITRA